MKSIMRTLGIFVFGILFSIAAVAGVVIYAQQEGGDSPDTPEIESTKVETPEVRNWQPGRVGERVKLHRDLIDSLGTAKILDRYGQSLIVGDFQDMRIKRFNPAGNFMKAYGVPSGRSEEAFEHYLGYAMTESGRLYVLDHGKRRMTAFQLESGARLFDKELDYQPYRVTAVGGFVVVHAAMTDSLFRVYDPEGNLEATFSPFPKNMENGAFDLVGDLIPFPQRELFIYAPSGASYLFYYDLQGNEVKEVITPDRNLFRAKGTGKFRDMDIFGKEKDQTSDSAYADSSGAREIPERTRTYDLDTDGQYIYASVSKLNTQNPQGFSLVDVFRLDTGEYVESFRLPTEANDVVVMGGVLYYLDRRSDSVHAYRIRRGISSGEAVAAEES
ncbi:MAG: hypothetical protein U5K31_15285 [Balneolaceae bacterium]|nr:hypothetical protein [Balneolaceae bacterium]